MKKVIGVCTTRVNEELCRNFLSRLHDKAKQKDYILAVFHSIYDFYRSDDENGAKEIFHMIPYEKLSVLIVMRDCIYHEPLLEMILEEAKGHDIPIIMIRGTDERCYSITGDSDKAYEQLIRSVIEEQGITDTFFMAGREHSDPDSQHRMGIYKKVLADCGIEFDESRVDYGCYWETPTEQAVDRMLKNGKVPPRAVFCSNDIMAFTVMKKLTQAGWRIPEDVIITGFDGLEHSVYCIPALTTCREDIDRLAELTIESVERAGRGETLERVQYYPYQAVITESSGHAHDSSKGRQETGIFYRMRVDEVDETNTNTWIDSVICNPCMDNLRRNLPNMVSVQNTISIRADAFFDESRTKHSPTEYLMIANDGTKQTEKLVAAEELIGIILENAVSERAVYLSMISKNDYIYGVACSESSDIAYESGRLNRYVQALNRALLTGMSGERLVRRASEEYGTKYVDALTGLANIDGATKWFEEQTSEFGAADKPLNVGIYTLMNYHSILESFGLEKAEDAIQYIGKSLKLANPEYAFIARTSIDTFTIIMTGAEISGGVNIVDNVIGLFYGFLDIKNKKMTPEEGMEVSCGYTDAQPPWYGKLSDYINAAVSKMYVNRVAFSKNLPKNLDKSDGAKVLEYYSMFLTLIKENLFNYHFQPIVDAHTGEIVAYEALMRTRGNIEMSPLEVLSTAAMYSKLLEVEYATFSNIFRRFAELRAQFGDKKVFINTIPGHFLTNEQCASLYSEYSHLLPNVVVEITESETITIDELDAIRSFAGRHENIKIAVDDYGTGHSNIVNLLEYNPQIVKIDRYLISNIQNDKNKQMFVKNLIEFAEQNNIKVLAEGVETREEMETVIKFGVDLIQGYYTGRPSEEVISEISPDIKDVICSIA